MSLQNSLPRLLFSPWGRQSLTLSHSQGILTQSQNSNPTLTFVLVDNTTVVGCVRKRSCVANRRINDAVILSLEILAGKDISFCLRYIASEDNPADVPSRIHFTSFTPQVRDSVQRRVTNFFTRAG